MADGVFGGLLGDGEEAAETASAETVAGADAFAMAVAAEQSKLDPAVAEATRAFLSEQAGLLRVQTAQLLREQAVRLHHLHGQIRESDLRRMGQRIRLATQIMITALFGLLVIVFLTMLYDAATSNSVVVDAFDAPPVLAPAGISGKVMATDVLDALQVLAATNRDPEGSLATQSAWSSEVQIDVPETGVSISEVDRLLHQRFGHDIHVGGNLIQTAAGGLTLTIRGDGLTPKSFSGSAGDLNHLAIEAAEYVYGTSQPYAFINYLFSHDRSQDALAFLPGAFAAAGTDALRAKLANGWGNAFSIQNEMAQAADKYRLAIALAPGYWTPRENLVITLASTEGEEAAWRASVDFMHALAAAGPGLNKRFYTSPAQITWDLPLLLEAVRADAAYNKGAGTQTTPDGVILADTEALLHDPASAARYLAASDPNDASTKAETMLLQAYAAFDRDDGAAAIPPMEAFWKAWQGSAFLKEAFIDNQCLLGLAYGLAGRLMDAEALFDKAGPWNRCYAFHGYALALAGRTADADRVWAEGQRLAPDLPVLPLYRGLYEAAHHLPAQAAADFAAANRAAPHFAEPLKAWGDLLAGQGRWTQARDKYDEALRYAPQWGALRQAQAALARKG
jgi:tetratricopeptide (TPR) repeat protein